jgi:hypothetical protein
MTCLYGMKFCICLFPPLELSGLATATLPLLWSFWSSVGWKGTLGPTEVLVEIKATKSAIRVWFIQLR